MCAKRKSYPGPRIPLFENEDEEREFWARHDATEFFDETEEATEPLVYTGPALRSSPQAVALKLEPGSVRRLSRLAKARGLRVGDLLRIWVAERLAQKG